MKATPIEHAPAGDMIVTRLLTRIKNKIASLFEPEEVEVTFEMKGDKVSYHYTKLPRKRVA